jgi:cytosine/adenosine deaminase-related metal-dependent hydrolase
MQTFLKNGYIVSMDQNDTVFDGGGVLVENDRITAVGRGRSRPTRRSSTCTENMFCPDL